MKRNSVLLLALVLSLLRAQAVWAIDPRELLVRSKAFFEEPDRPRGGGLSAASLKSQETMHQALVDQQNTLQALSVDPQPRLATTAATTMEATSGAVQVGWSGGSTYPVILYDPKVQGRMYALSDSSGFYRSTDGGATWHAANQGIANYTIASLVVTPSNSNVLYAGTFAGMQKSVDAGQTWTTLATPASLKFKRLSNYRSIAVSQTDSNRLYAGSSTGQVFASTNGGASWTQLGNLNIGAVPVSAVHLARDGRVFAGSSAGLYLWRPATNSWQKLSLTKNAAYDIVSLVANGVETIYVTNGLQIARTSDAGVPSHWMYTNAMPRYDASSEGEASRLAVRRLSNGQVQIFVGQKRGWQGRAYLSSDGGATWKNVSQGFTYDASVDPTRAWKKNGGVPISVAFDPFNASTFVMTDDWGIWKSTDNAATWKEAIKGTPNTIGTSLTRDPYTGTYLVGTMDNGLVEINPTTGAMKAVFPTASTNALYQGHVWRVEVLANHNRVLTLSPWNATRNYVVVIKPDGTQTFANGLPTAFPKTNTVWDKGYPRGLVVDPVNPNKLYLGIDGDAGGLFISTDGGFNWTRSSGQPASKKIYYGLAVDPTNPNRIYWGTMWAGSSGGVYKSWDGGKTWTRAFSGSPNVGDVTVGKDGVVYAAADSAGAPAVYVSRDKGVTWSLLKKFDGSTGVLAQAVTIDPNNPKRIVVSTRKWNDYSGAKIYMTLDGGATWNEAPSAGLPNSSGAAETRFSPDGKSLYVLLNNGTLFNVPLA